MNTKENLTRVPDESVVLFFVCPQCGDQEAVHPGEELAASGCPYCVDCETDMEYASVAVDRRPVEKMLESLAGLVATLEAAWGAKELTAPRYVQCQLGEEVKRAKRIIAKAEGRS